MATFCPALAIMAAVMLIIQAGPVAAAGRSLTQDPVAIAKLLQQFKEEKQADGRAAKAFCESPEFTKLSCGFASEAEISATIQKQCPLCGTLYFGMPENLPSLVEGVDRYNTWGIRPLSLACKGPVIVRSVFKITEAQPIIKKEGYQGTNCTGTYMVHVDDNRITKGGNASPVVRCELDLPKTDGSEEQRAVNAKETKCWPCERCADGKGCPGDIGKWYSDSYTTVARGCGIDPQTGYEYHRAGINMNPYTKIQLAKFEVCNSAGCFDAAYEQQKLKAAKPCIKGLCVRS